jgi:hypothetical protein
MAISQELQDRYSSECDIDWRNAFVLYHPSAGYRYLIDDSHEFIGFVDGVLKTFLPVPAKVKLPALDDSGRQEMSITWANISREAQVFLDAAVQGPDSPVICRYSIYLLDNQTAHIDPWIEFHLSFVSITEEVVMVTASRVDILNRIFPGEVYRPDRFPGLVR